MTDEQILGSLNSSSEFSWKAIRDEFVCKICNGMGLALRKKSALINLNSRDWQNVRRNPRTEELRKWIIDHQQELAVKSAAISNSNPRPGSNAVCLSIQLSCTWKNAPNRIVETAKRILQEVKTKFSLGNTMSQTAGGGSANTAPTSVSEPVATQKTSKTSGKGAKADTLDWSNVSFCDKKVITHKDVVDILVDGKTAHEKIFPGSMRDIFLQRYKKMQENFMEPLSEEVWRQGGNSKDPWGDGLSLANPKRYKDALLRIDAKCFSKEDEFWVGKDGLLKYPCVGHDLPVWLSLKNKNEKDNGKKIMIVSQDPLRSGHGSGALYLSTPWGLHSREYRSGRLLYKQLFRLLETGATIYLTDWWKIYNRYKSDKGGLGWCCDEKKKGVTVITHSCQFATDTGCSCHEWGNIETKKKSVRSSLKDSYEKAFSGECGLFHPDCIITLGEDTIGGVAFEPFNFDGRKKDESIWWTLYHPEAHWRKNTNPLHKKGYKNLEDYYEKAFAEILKNE